MVKTLSIRLVLTAIFLLTLAAMTSAQDIIPTPSWVNWKGTITIDGQPAPVGTIINFYDADTVNCGRDTVRFEGIFGFTSVYADDSETPAVDEGAELGDTIQFKVLGLTPTIDSGVVTWTGDKDTVTTHLSLSGVSVGLEIVDAPTSTGGEPNDTVRFEIGVHNTGNITDFYGINITQSKDPAWEIIQNPEFVYNDPDSIAYIWFDVVVPPFIGEPPVDSITYTVYSIIDPTVTDSGQVELDFIVLDAEDPDDLLPNAFALHQNYPNPFNPSTTVSFTLPRITDYELTVYNVLGQEMQQFTGRSNVGENQIDINAGTWPSGVYFYRLQADDFKATRKMVLVK